MKKINYHTHTYRCGHATGSEEEMVQAAIDLHIEELGISEHIPLPYFRRHLLKSLPHVRSVHCLISLIHALIKDGPDMRMSYYQLTDYLKDVEESAINHHDEINVLKGFEAEYLEEYLSFYQELLSTYQIDYLILGNDYNKYCIPSRYYGKNRLSKKEIYCYCNDIEKAMDTNLFSYIAHPDLFLDGYKTFDDDARVISQRICTKAHDLAIPLELNGQRFNDHKLNDDFWKIAGQTENKIIIGLDAHSPEDFNQSTYDGLESYAKKLNLKLIDEFEIRKGKENKNGLNDYI